MKKEVLFAGSALLLTVSCAQGAPIPSSSPSPTEAPPFEVALASDHPDHKKLIATGKGPTPDQNVRLAIAAINANKVQTGPCEITSVHADSPTQVEVFTKQPDCNVMLPQPQAQTPHEFAGGYEALKLGTNVVYLSAQSRNALLRGETAAYDACKSRGNLMVVNEIPTGSTQLPTAAYLLSPSEACIDAFVNGKPLAGLPKTGIIELSMDTSVPVKVREPRGNTSRQISLQTA